MVKPLYLLLCGMLVLQLPVRAQRKMVSEMMLVYEYSAGPAAKGKTEGIEYAVHTVYIKGHMSRSEMTSPLFSSTVIYDANTGSGVILKELSGQKLLIRLDPGNWAERNKPYDGIVYKPTGETKEIAGYRCIKAVGQTASGVTITVFYTRDLLPENRQYEPPFRTLDGLPLEYDLVKGDVKIHYRVSSISLNPVPASKFDIPTSGYREMKYEESKKMNIGG
jgi:GLPGLI family protein